MYNSYFLIIYKPLSLIIFSQTFSMQLGASTLLFCLSQCAILFCTLLVLYEQHWTDPLLDNDLTYHSYHFCHWTVT